MSKLTNPPKPVVASNQTNAEFRRRAHDRLEQVFNDLEGRGEYGTAGVEITFERGTAVTIRRTLDGTDRPTR
jgi:hypothetical protein